MTDTSDLTTDTTRLTGAARAKDIASFVIVNCVAIGTVGLCAYLYLTGQEVPSELSLSATAANAYLFGKRSV